MEETNGATSEETAAVVDLTSWFSTLRPLRVDIVGDFAGDELFIIHGESLIRHCLADYKVDFDGKLFSLGGASAIV